MPGAAPGLTSTGFAPDEAAGLLAGGPVLAEEPAFPAEAEAEAHCDWYACMRALFPLPVMSAAVGFGWVWKKSANCPVSLALHSGEMGPGAELVAVFDGATDWVVV